MGHQKIGRAGRCRRWRRCNVSQKVSVGDQQQFVDLLKFLCGRGFNGSVLQPCLFSDTGRGLQARCSIQPGQLLVSLPESCLITTSTVLKSELGEYIKRWQPRLSALLVLCVFLLFERRRGGASDWSGFIQVLPKSYTCPAYFSDNVMGLLPASLRRRGLEQRETLQELHSSSQNFFRSLQPLLNEPALEVMSYEALRWAWCSVNTRCVFMPQPSSHFLSGKDDSALAPFLDLLNHQPDIQVNAGFNQVNKCYEIKSVSGTRRHHQAFINYGPHDNHSLLLEYGFVAPANPHSVVYVDPEILHQIILDGSSNEKMKFLLEHDFLRDLNISIDGPSWRLMTAIRLLSLPLSYYKQWRGVLQGQQVGEEREQWCQKSVQKLIATLLGETVHVLEEICTLLPLCPPSEQQQLILVKSLRAEEKCILESCLDKMS